VISALGEDNSANAFLALQRGAFDVTKLVVVKQVRAELAAEPKRLGRLVDDWRRALRFNHPNLLHTYEVNADSADCHLVREYLEGHTLAQLLQRVGREQFGVDEYVWILAQVLSGLHYAHELADFDGRPLGIVHGDVKPGNVFITSTGEVKLLGFGGAGAATPLKQTYASPEQRAGRALDARSDVYSVGVMLWEAIARRPRSGNDSPLAALARLENLEPAIESVVPDAPPALIAACRLALARNPAQRAGSAHELERLLDDFANQRGHNVLARNVSRLMRVHFERDLAEVRQAIEAHVNAMPRSSVRPIPELLSRASLTPHSRAYGFVHSQAPAKPTRPRYDIAIGVGLVAVGLGVGSLAFTRRAPEPTPTVTVGAAEPRVTARAEQPPFVAATPPVVRSPAPQPIDVPSPRATEPTTRVPVRFSRRANTIANAPAASVSSEHVAPAPTVVSRSAATAAPQPGVDLTKGRAAHSTRQIDDKDPY
jgi:serine/threonine-protein kinase